MFIIGAIIAIGVLVFVHESGHFLAARFWGVTVEKFSLGFGPRLFGFKRGKTDFFVSLIPLGGYVKMKGDEPEVGQKYEPDEFYGISWWKRITIVFAGPFANFVFGCILLFTSFLVGRVIEDHYPIVGRVNETYQNILLPQDRIISLNDKQINYWNDLWRNTNKEEINELLIERDGELITLQTAFITPETWSYDVLPLVQPIIGTIAPGMPAYRFGLRENDEIIAVDNLRVGDWFDMREAISKHPGNEVELLVRRDDETFLVTVPLEQNLLDTEGNKMIGITQQLPVQHLEKFGVVQSLNYGFSSAASFIVINYQALFQMVSKPLIAKDHLGGPVMLISMSKQTSKMGLGAIIAFIASVSFILMIMNLLPIPVLDGGHIFFFLIEGIRRKPIPFNVQAVIQQIGFGFLMLLMVFVFYNDFSKIVRRSISPAGHQMIQEENILQ